MAEHILILNGSPKQNGGTSRFLSKLIGVQLVEENWGCEKMMIAKLRAN